MKTYKNLYPEVYSVKNLVLAWRKARKGKTRKSYVAEFERNLGKNIKTLHEELKNQTYSPKPLKTFILRDPKTRKISKSDFRDRVVHHALCNILDPIYEKVFIPDNCACRKNKGSLFALKRFRKFQRKVTKNLTSSAYCLKADIKHYFQEVDHYILLEIIKRKIRDEEVIWLIKRILKNNVRDNPSGKGMPLGNLTSQFFANVYLSELDQFVKYRLRAKFYIRYVDDFVLMDSSKKQLKIGGPIENFLSSRLRLELHPQKYKLIPLSKGMDFVGFRNFYHFRLLRERNIKTMKNKVTLFADKKISCTKMSEVFQGWNAYAKWANAFNLRKDILNQIIENL